MNQTRTSAFTCERPDTLNSYHPSGSNSKNCYVSIEEKNCFFNVGKCVAELSGKESIL